MTAVDDIRGTTSAPDRRLVVSLLRRMVSEEGRANPQPYWARMRALGDVVPAPWGAYFVTGFDVCTQVLRGRNRLVPDFAWQQRRPDPERRQAPATQEMTGALSRLHPPVHTRMRRALGNLFSRQTLRDMTPDVDEHVSGLLDDLEAELSAHGEADFVGMVSEQLPMRTVGRWLAIDPVHHQRVPSFTHRQVHAQELLPTKSQLAVSAQATPEIRDFFTRLLAERRAHLDNDVVTDDSGVVTDVVSDWIRYWDAQYPGDRSAADQVLYDLVMFTTIASLETTATLLTNIIWFLTQDPARTAWLREYPERVDDAIDEVLRYDPPIQLNTRVAARDTVLAGVLVHKDAMVRVLFGAANHDPRRNPEPHRFDSHGPDPPRSDPRRKGVHLSFGGGIHHCLGVNLARIEARRILAQVLERLPTLQPVAPPTYGTRMVFRRITSLKVTS